VDSAVPLGSQPARLCVAPDHHSSRIPEVRPDNAPFSGTGDEAKGRWGFLHASILRHSVQCLHSLTDGPSEQRRADSHDDEREHRGTDEHRGTLSPSVWAAS
jgi:hypothetical protein